MAEYEAQVRVVSFEGTTAVLETEDGQQLRWSIKKLPDDVKAGDTYRLIFSSDRTEIESRERLARSVLNHLLQT